jgi:hypothetical protein
MTLQCEQCGGTLEVLPQNLLVKCPYCGVALTYDKSGFIGHFIVKRLIPYPMAARVFETRLAHARIGALVEKPDPELFYFPFWRITTKHKGDEEVRFTLGANPETTLLSRARLPEGELAEYRLGSEYDAPIREATVSADAALARLSAHGEEFDTVRELTLIQAPFYLQRIKTKEGKRHVLLLEASSGRLYDDLPQRSGALALSETGLPYLITFFVFLLEGILIRNSIAKLIVFCLTMVPAYLALSTLRDQGSE